MGARPAWEQGLHGSKACMGARPARKQGRHGSRACMGARPAWEQGPHGSKACMGAGPTWEQGPHGNLNLASPAFSFIQGCPDRLIPYIAKDNCTQRSVYYQSMSASRSRWQALEFIIVIRCLCSCVRQQCHFIQCSPFISM